MKLSQMETDHVFDVLAVAAIELEPILNDEKIISLLSKVDVSQVTDESAFGLNRMKQMLSVVLAFSKTYRLGIYKILAEFSKETVEVIGKKTLSENIKQIFESLNDEEFLSFFPSLRAWVQKKSSSTSSKPNLVKVK